MYVVKVGEYYVCSYDGLTILLSKEVMKSYPLKIAETFAVKLNGEIIKMSEGVTNE